MQYKGFETTNIEQTIIDENESVYSAKVINSADYLEVSAKELEDLEPRFHKTIDEYIDLCTQYHKSPFQIT